MITVQRAKPVIKNICEIGKERIRRAGDKIRSDHPDADIDIDLKYLELPIPI